MNLTLNTPNEIVLNLTINKVVAEGTHGSFCLLPRHVDFLAALVPGLLSWVDETGKESFAAVGNGILVKRANDVYVSAEAASHGTELEELRRLVREEFSQMDEQQRAAHTAVARLEADFLRRTMALTEDHVV
ncbi:F0F1 ATP synthase subunit epsilon [Rhodopirellula baltica SH28]|uniref:F0F1 ATP synthase subunit epsilon n=1 Tax=Rhodopirellula baltica SH28 TaxID=993517 RepID=K5CXS1_RHOBT|nr:F0F1 ATP synthase subunit epsilon [Rhodopirellula baltica]EKJ98906.1 F0F1 ATP synthase subunit epsilon [Rhodopirellula baltica SH28]